MNLSDVMDDLASALETVPDLRVYAWGVVNVTPPAATVLFPETMTYDQTMGRGSDRLDVPVMVAVGKVDARTSRDALGQYADGSGTHSVKAAIEAFTATAYDSARVQNADFGTTTIGGVEMLAVTFLVDVIGDGS